MIVDNVASLCVYSETRRMSEVTDRLGVEPMHTHDVGDLHPSAHRYPETWVNRHRRQGAWVYDVRFEGGSEVEDQTGAGSLRELLAIFADRIDAIVALRPEFDVVVSWGGFSDSSQGGFVLEADLLAGLAALRCDFFGTAYLDEPDEDAALTG